MRIDYMQNPLGIVKRFDIPYGTEGSKEISVSYSFEGRHLKQRVIILSDGNLHIKGKSTPSPTKDLHLEGRIIAHVEEGFSEVTWFDGEIVYNNPDRGDRTRHYEVGGMKGDLPFQRCYQALKSGSSLQEEVEQMLRNWCSLMNLEISGGVEPAGIRR